MNLVEGMFESYKDSDAGVCVCVCVCVCTADVLYAVY